MATADYWQIWLCLGHLGYIGVFAFLQGWHESESRGTRRRAECLFVFANEMALVVKPGASHNFLDAEKSRLKQFSCPFHSQTPNIFPGGEASC